MELHVKLRKANIQATKTGFIAVTGHMKKQEAKSFLYYMMIHNPWAWEYLTTVRDKLDNRGVE